MPSVMQALWHYRGFILGSVRREFDAKYRNSVLGAMWHIIHPLAMIAIYTIVFSEVMQAKLPAVSHSYGYSIYLCAGIISWSLFSEICTRSVTMFLDNANLLKKIQFPRLCLPIVVLATAGMNFAILLAVFLGVLVLIGYFPGPSLLALLPVVSLLVFVAISLGLLLSVLHVFFRDVGQFFTIFIQFWFWLTPIVYPISMVPERFTHLLMLNPVVPLIAAIQDIMVHGAWPQWSSMAYPLLFALVALGGGVVMYRRHCHDMVDEL